MATADFELLLELRELSKRAAHAEPPSEKISGRRELEDRIAFFLFLLSRIHRDCQLWSQGVQAKAVAFTWDDSREFSELYALWLNNVEPTVSKLSAFQGTYGPLEGAEKLRACYQNVKLMSLDTGRVRQSVESLLSGEGISFDSAMEELRANLR